MRAPAVQDEAWSHGTARHRLKIDGAGRTDCKHLSVAVQSRLGSVILGRQVR